MQRTENGRRLESIILHMVKKMKSHMDDEDMSLYFAYLDRLLKATTIKVNVAETVLNVKGFLVAAKKQYGALPTDTVIKVND